MPRLCLVLVIIISCAQISGICLAAPLQRRDEYAAQQDPFRDPTPEYISPADILGSTLDYLDQLRAPEESPEDRAQAKEQEEAKQKEQEKASSAAQENQPPSDKAAADSSSTVGKQQKPTDTNTLSTSSNEVQNPQASPTSDNNTTFKVWHGARGLSASTADDQSYNTRKWGGGNDDNISSKIPMPDDGRSSDNLSNSAWDAKSVPGQSKEINQANTKLATSAAASPFTDDTSEIANDKESNAARLQFVPLMVEGNPADEQTPQLLPVLATRKLDSQMRGITHVVLYIHDATRDPASGVGVLSTMAAERLSNTLVVAPWFPLASDISRLGAQMPDNGRDVARWPLLPSGTQNSWAWGGESQALSNSASASGISSFTVLDVLVSILIQKARLPNLRQITIMGHGAGADLVQRYAAVGRAPRLSAKQGLNIHFLVLNPSTFVYLTARRPMLAQGSAEAVTENHACPSVNNWPYGLDGNLPNYVRRIGINEVRLGYPEQYITVLTARRTLADPLRDNSCAALAQGIDRAERARNFAQHLTQSFGDKISNRQAVIVISDATYGLAEILTTPMGQKALRFSKSLR